MLDAGAVDVQQADASRCAGVSEFLRVGALCDAANLPMSAHTFPFAAFASVLCTVAAAEYETLRSRPHRKNNIDGVIQPKDQQAFPLTSPGRAWGSN